MRPAAAFTAAAPHPLPTRPSRSSGVYTFHASRLVTNTGAAGGGRSHGSAPQRPVALTHPQPPTLVDDQLGPTHVPVGLFHAATSARRQLEQQEARRARGAWGAVSWGATPRTPRPSTARRASGTPLDGSAAAAAAAAGAVGDDACAAQRAHQRARLGSHSSRGSHGSRGSHSGAGGADTGAGGGSSTGGSRTKHKTKSKKRKKRRHARSGSGSGARSRRGHRRSGSHTAADTTSPRRQHQPRHRASPAAGTRVHAYKSPRVSRIRARADPSAVLKLAAHCNDDSPLGDAPIVGIPKAQFARQPSAASLASSASSLGGVTVPSWVSASPRAVPGAGAGASAVAMWARPLTGSSRSRARLARNASLMRVAGAGNGGDDDASLVPSPDAPRTGATASTATLPPRGAQWEPPVVVPAIGAGPSTSATGGRGDRSPAGEGGGTAASGAAATASTPMAVPTLGAALSQLTSGAHVFATRVSDHAMALVSASPRAPTTQSQPVSSRSSHSSASQLAWLAQQREEALSHAGSVVAEDSEASSDAASTHSGLSSDDGSTDSDTELAAGTAPSYSAPGSPSLTRMSPIVTPLVSGPTEPPTVAPASSPQRGLIVFTGAEARVDASEFGQLQELLDHWSAGACKTMACPVCFCAYTHVQPSHRCPNRCCNRRAGAC